MLTVFYTQPIMFCACVWPTTLSFVADVVRVTQRLHCTLVRHHRHSLFMFFKLWQKILLNVNCTIFSPFRSISRLWGVARHRGDEFECAVSFIVPTECSNRVPSFSKWIFPIFDCCIHRSFSRRLEHFGLLNAPLQKSQPIYSECVNDDQRERYKCRNFSIFRVVGASSSIRWKVKKMENGRRATHLPLVCQLQSVRIECVWSEGETTTHFTLK